MILTTHDMEDIERLCPRVIVIDKGQKMYDGNLKYLKDFYLRSYLFSQLFGLDFYSEVHLNDVGSLVSVAIR